MPLTTCARRESRHVWPERIIGNLATASGFVRKDMTIALSYRLQFMFQFSRVFFKVVVIYFIGQMVGSSGTPAALRAYRADYFPFALVGLAVNSYLTTGLVTVTNDVRQMMNQGILEAMCAGPVGYRRLLCYTMLWPFLSATVRVGLYFLLGVTVFNVRLPHANWPGAALVMALSIPIFLLLGVTSSSILIITKRGDPVNWLFSGISGILAGTMFPITVLPNWLRVVAGCLPLTHSLEALRRFLLVGATCGEVSHHLVGLLIFLVLLTPLAAVINDACVRKAKRAGVLSTH